MLDALAAMARNRGWKLIRSRTRTPGKGDFGKVGLADGAGRPVFGLKGKRLTASRAEAESHLRGLLGSDWIAPLGAKRPVKEKAQPNSMTNAGTRAASKQRRKSKPPLEPWFEIRDAVPADAPSLVKLIALLNHSVDADGVRQRLRALSKAGEAPIVAILGNMVVGLCATHRMIVVHRPCPVGRITRLVVADDARGKGCGRMLIEEAEARLGSEGCGLVEVTSNDQLIRAHAFYRHLGYERTSMRFAKPLGLERS